MSLPATPSNTPLLQSRIGFAFNSMDRPEFTRQSLEALDLESGFDVIWIDGSRSARAVQLTYDVQLERANLVERHREIRGGPDQAILFGLSRLLELGYDYCGLLENDVILRPGWLCAIVAAKAFAEQEGLQVGAITARNYRSRVLKFRTGYSINWCVGAGMVLFSRQAAALLVQNYMRLGSLSSAQISEFYKKTFSVDLSGVWELHQDQPDRPLGIDWGYSPFLYAHGLSSIGTLPNYGTDLQFDVTRDMRTEYCE